MPDPSVSIKPSHYEAAGQSLVPTTHGTCPHGFMEYYSSFMSLAGMEKMTGINQKQLSNYLNHRAVPRKKQAERIREGIHKFAHELLSITL